ncbi:unnamed protein product [Closterium sp. Yama58-4]|nr:unnamed protein product [Closterium sp. Yama58-4]
MAEPSLSILTCTEMNELETQMVHVDDFARLTSSTSDAIPDPVSRTGAIDPNASGVSSFHTIEPQEIHDAMLRQDTTLAAERDPAVAEAVANDQDETVLRDSEEVRQLDDYRDTCMDSNEAINQHQSVIDHDKMDVDAIPPPIDQDQAFPKEIHEETHRAATDQEISGAPTDHEIHEGADHKDCGLKTSSTKEEVKMESCNEVESPAVIEATGAVATEATESTAKVAGDAEAEVPGAATIEVAGDVATEAAGETVTKVESASVDHVESRGEEAPVPAGEANEDVKMEDVNDGAHGSDESTEANQGATDGSNDANKDDGTGDVVAASDKEGDTAKDDAEARAANPAMDADNAANCSSPRATSQKANDASAMSPPRDPAVAALGAETNGDTPPPSKPGAGTPSFSVGTPSVAADTPRQQTISPDSQSSLVDPGLVADESAAPFTISQWQQLEQQALIFKYLVSGAAVPPELIDSLYSTADSPRQSPDGPASWATPLKDAEPLRCRRTDGKKWRCSREAVTDQKYCERHMHRGRNRVGKSRRLSDKATAGSSLSIQAASSEGPMGCVEGTCSAMTDTCTDTPCHKGLVPKFELGSVSKLEIGSVSKLRLNTDDVGSSVTRGALGCSKQLAIQLSPENTGSPVPTGQQPHDPACTPSAAAAPAASASAAAVSDATAAPSSSAVFTPFGLPEPTPAPSSASAPPPEAVSSSGNQWQAQPAQAPPAQQQQQWQSPCPAPQQQTPRSQQQGGQWQGQNQPWQPDHTKQAHGQAPMTPVMQPQQQQGMGQAGQPPTQQTPYTPQQGQSRQGAGQRGEACKFSSRALVLSGEPESPETHPLVSARSAYADAPPKTQQPLQQQQQMRVQAVQGQQQPMNVQHQAQPQPQVQVPVQQAPMQQASMMQPQPMQTTAIDDSPWEEASALIGRSPNLGPLPCVDDADDCSLISGPPSQYFSVNPSDSQDAFLAA